MNNNNQGNFDQLNNLIQSLQTNIQNNGGQAAPNVQNQQQPNQFNMAIPLLFQQNQMTQHRLSRLNSKLQRSGILLQNLALFGERNAQQGTMGSQMFQEAARTQRQRNDEIRARRGGNRCVSLNAGLDLNKQENAKRQTEQVMQAAQAASGFNSSLQSSIDGVELDEINEQEQGQLDQESLNINANLLNQKSRKGPGYHSKFVRQQDIMTKQKDTHKQMLDKSKHVRVQSIQISLNYKNNFPKKLRLQPLGNSPNRLLRGQQRHVTCMSEGYQLERQGQGSRLVEDAPSSLHLSPLARNQNCCNYNCFHPFVMSDNSFDVPAALFLNLICHNINMPDEHAIVVLALIDRFCSKVAELNYDQNRFYKRIPNEGGQQDAAEQQSQIRYCCSQMTINSQTIHKLILTSALVTQKFYSDIFYSNNFFSSRCGFIEAEELNRLEEIFLDVIDWNLTVDFEEYETYESGLQQFFEAPLQPETIRIIEENDEAYNNLMQNQNQQIFNQEFEQWSYQSAQRLQMLERMIQQQQNQAPNNFAQGLQMNHNNTGATSEMQQNSQNMQFLQDLMVGGGGQNQVAPAALNLDLNQQDPNNLGGLANILPGDLAHGQQHVIDPQQQDASQLNMHLLNIAIACEMQRQQSLNQQIGILSSLLQQLQMHDLQQRGGNNHDPAPLP